MEMAGCFWGDPAEWGPMQESCAPPGGKRWNQTQKQRAGTTEPSPCSKAGFRGQQVGVWRGTEGMQEGAA